jgi:hypothetical protein
MATVIRQMLRVHTKYSLPSALDKRGAGGGVRHNESGHSGTVADLLGGGYVCGYKQGHHQTSFAVDTAINAPTPLYTVLNNHRS